MADENVPPGQSRKKTKELSNEERIALVAMLIGMAPNGRLPHGALTNVGKIFGVNRDTARRHWQNATLSRSQGTIVQHEIKSKKHQRGRKLLWDREAIKEATKEVPVNVRDSLKALSAQLDVPESTLYHMRHVVFKRHTSAIKPKLTDDHKIARIDYALTMRDAEKDNKTYQDMYDRVHVDEKWFYLTKDKRCYILAIDEEPPKRTTSHKGFIAKVMFLCACARPRRLLNGEWWDGKIGLWPIGRWGRAKRKSKNRPKGAPVWINENVNRDKYRELMIDKVLPAILAKFPKTYLERGVMIQQDGAKAHIDPADAEWLDALEQLAPGNIIVLYNQPAQSPDLNINDLAFFRSIQSLYYESAPANQEELIQAVLEAFRRYCPTKMNRMWLTLMSCCNQILEHNGDNHYSITHMNKEKLEREGRLPKVIDVSPAARNFDPNDPNHP